MEKAVTEKEPKRPTRFRDLLPWHHANGDASDEPFESLQRSMNRLFESFRREIGTPANGDFGIVSSKMDVAETDEAFEVTIELPGIEEKDVDVTVTRDALAVRGEKRAEKTEKKKDMHLRECSYGRVERVVPLPDGVDADKVVAKFKNGVLKVTLPKKPEARTQARKVEIAS